MDDLSKKEDTRPQMQNLNKKEDVKSLMHDFNSDSSGKILSMKMIVILVVVALLGVGTGYALSQNSSSTDPITGEKVASKSDIKKGEKYGDADMSVFKDTAEGELKEGGIEGEGQFHLVRPGGESQNVYLTSSVVDLSLFVGKKIKVWGKTFEAQKAGWLMDVGQVEVL